MRAGTVGAFGLGFAAGVLSLGIALLATGHIETRMLPAPIVVTPALLPEVSAAAPAAVSPTLPELVPARLAMPLAGIDPAKLPDTFNDARGGRKHEALDIMAPRGTPVMAVAEGNVVKLFTSKRGGLTVYQFDNSRTLCFYYAHLDRYAEGLKEGMLLRTGDVLGYVGSTGDASPDAPHLHFGVSELGPEKHWWEGTAINPLPMLRHTR